MSNSTIDAPPPASRWSPALFGAQITSFMRTRQSRIERYLVLLWLICATALLFWCLHDHGFDDPYITYRYAANIAHGHGFVYNPGERVLSTTAPLYALLLAPAQWLHLPIPLASNAIGCLSLVLGGVALWKLGQVWHARLVGIAGLVLYPTFPLIVPTLGAETALYVTLILFGFLAYAHRRYYALAILLALATLIRADAVLAAVVIGLHFLIYRRHPVPWRAIVLYAALLAPWFIFAWIYFGAPLPVTLAAKQRQGSMAISQGFFEGFLGLLSGYWSIPLYRLHFPLALTGLIYALARQRRWLLLLAWNGLYIAAYTTLGVTRYFWYYGPLAAGVVVLVALGVSAVYQLIQRIAGTRWAAGAATVLLLALLVAPVQALNTLRSAHDPRLEIYQQVGAWLQAHTPLDASVGTLEVGIIGYYAQRRMIDFAGLIQPETGLQFSPSTTYEDGALWAVQRFQPAYLVLQDGLFPRLEQDSAFQARCRARETFADAHYAGVLVVYVCVEHREHRGEGI